MNIRYFLCAVLTPAFGYAHAAEPDEKFHFGGVQTAIALSDEVPLNTNTQHASVGLYGWANYFGAMSPDGNSHVGFAYVGPSIAPTFKSDKFSLWISPLATVAINHFEDGVMGVGPSLWVNLGFAKDRVNLFLDTEVYFDVLRKGNHVWYGYYALTDGPTEWFSYGAQVEFYGKAVVAGPEVSFTKGPLTYRVMFMTNDKAIAYRQMIIAEF